MIYKLITFKLYVRSIVRLLFLFMAYKEDPNMKANLLVFSVSNFLFMIHPGWDPSNVKGLGRYNINLIL